MVLVVKNPPANLRDLRHVSSIPGLVGKILWRRYSLWLIKIGLRNVILNNTNDPKQTFFHIIQYLLERVRLPFYPRLMISTRF